MKTKCRMFLGAGAFAFVFLFAQILSANAAVSTRKLDVKRNDISILDSVGGSQSSSVKINPGDVLTPSVYQSDGATSIPWSNYRAYISSEACTVGSCDPGNPLMDPTNWDAGTVFLDSYTIPESAQLKYVAILSADEATGAGVSGYWTRLMLVGPPPKPNIYTYAYPGSIQVEWDWNWQYMGSLSSYILQYKPSNESTWTSIPITSDNGAWYRLNNLHSQFPFDFRVALIDSGSVQSEFSDVANDSAADTGPAAIDFFGYGREGGNEDWNESSADNTNTSFSNPSGIAIDNNHHRMFVADGGGDGMWNNRVMVFNLNVDNTPIDHIADAVIYSVNIDGSESYLSQPRNVLYDQVSDRLFIGDSNNGRVIVIDASDNFVTDENVDDPVTVPDAQNVLGAGDFYYPLGMTLDTEGGKLFVAEKNKQKGSVYGSINVFDVRPAGSPEITMCGNATTGISNSNPSCRLWVENAYAPRDVAYDDNNKVLYAAYADENRIFALDIRNEKSASKTICGVTTNGLPVDDADAMTPSCVLGQNDFESTNSDTTINTLDVPRGLWYEKNSDVLFVADLGNNRVLQFNNMANISNGMDADLVFGQADFNVSDSGTSRFQFENPNAVTVDSVNGYLYVSDAWNNRVMVFNIDKSNDSEPINIGPTPEKFQEDVSSGFIVINGGNPLDTTKVTFDVDYTIIAGDAKVVLPAGTEMIKSGGGSLNFTELDFEDITTALKSATTSNIAGAVSIGIPNLNLTFSKNITVTIPVATSLNGQTLNIYYQNNGQSDWSSGLSCTVANGQCIFETNHATKYSAGDEPDGTIQEEVKQAKIDDWDAYLYTDKSKCVTRLKLEIEGHNFDKHAEVKIGGKSASSVDRKSSKKIEAKFCMDKLLDVKTNLSRKITVINPDAKKSTAKSKIDLRTVSELLTAEDLDMQTTQGIKNIQQALVQLKYLNKDFITGTYGEETRSAVKKFQKKYGIEQTGTVGSITRQKLGERIG